MDIVSLTPKKYKEWDDFCLTSDDAWSSHNFLWQDYVLNYRPAASPKLMSFMVFKNNQIIAACPLILETHQGLKEFSFGNDYGLTPVFANFLTVKERHDVEKLVFAHIDQLAQDNNVCRSRFRLSVLSRSFIEAECPRFNYLARFGYLDTSINTQLIDLRKSISELKSDLRHGHSYDIDRAGKILQAEIFDKDNITQKIFDEYVKLHQKAAGRITRPRATFDIMYKAIKKEDAFLVGAKKAKKFIGFSYFSGFKNNADYSSSCNDPDEANIPISHFIQWNAIQWMKKKGFLFYEIGWQYFSNTLYDFPTEKEINISNFKRGFGGFTVPLFRGEKYYDKEYFLEVQKERVNKLADILKNKNGKISK